VLGLDVLALEPPSRAGALLAGLVSSLNIAFGALPRADMALWCQASASYGGPSMLLTAFWMR